MIDISTHNTCTNLCKCCVWYDDCNSFQENKKTDATPEENSAYLHYRLDNRHKIFGLILSMGDGAIEQKEIRY